MTDASSLITTEYAGNYVYENSILQFFNHAEGYVEPNGTGWQYVFQYKDHLGNVRLSYADADGNGLIAQTEIREENNYYPFGLKHKGYNNVVTSTNPAQKFKYNGVEYEESLGLNMYEMDFRQYDPAIGRFTSIDPVTHFSQSTYTSFDNNPIYWTDPSGTTSVQDLIDQATPSVKYTSNSDGTFTGNGHTIGEKQGSPTEGQKRPFMRGIPRGAGVYQDGYQYYHSGGVEGSEQGGIQRMIILNYTEQQLEE